jgi:hypothetical protein
MLPDYSQSILKVNRKRREFCTNLTGMILTMRCTSGPMLRDGMRMFVSGDLDHISLTRTPQGQGVANRENVVAL